MFRALLAETPEAACARVSIVGGFAVWKLFVDTDCDDLIVDEVLCGWFLRRVRFYGEGSLGFSVRVIKFESYLEVR